MSDLLYAALRTVVDDCDTPATTLEAVVATTHHAAATNPIASRLRAAVAAHPAATPEILAELAFDPQKAVRCAAVGRPGCPEATLLTVAKKEREVEVLKHLLAGAARPDSVFDVIVKKMLRPKSSDELWEAVLSSSRLPDEVAADLVPAAIDRFWLSGEQEEIGGGHLPKLSTTVATAIVTHPACFPTWIEQLPEGWCAFIMRAGREHLTDAQSDRCFDRAVLGPLAALGPGGSLSDELGARIYYAPTEIQDRFRGEIAALIADRDLSECGRRGWLSEAFAPSPDEDRRLAEVASSTSDPAVLVSLAGRARRPRDLMLAIAFNPATPIAELLTASSDLTVDELAALIRSRDVLDAVTFHAVFCHPELLEELPTAQRPAVIAAVIDTQIPRYSGGQQRHREAVEGFIDLLSDEELCQLPADMTCRQADCSTRLAGLVSSLLTPLPAHVLGLVAELLDSPQADRPLADIVEVAVLTAGDRLAA